jgi:hypothetical protein
MVYLLIRYKKDNLFMQFLFWESDRDISFVGARFSGSAVLLIEGEQRGHLPSPLPT